MDASQLPKGKSSEKNSEGRVNEPGIYRHKDTGAEFITSDGEEGSIMADSLLSPVWKDAWERVGDVPTRLEQLAARKAQEIKDVKAEAAQKKAEQAELDAAVKEIEDVPTGGQSYTPKTEKAEAVK